MSEDNTSSIREEDAKNDEKYKTKITDSLNIHNLMKVDDKHEVKNNSNFSFQFERNAVKSDIVCPHCHKVFQTKQEKLRHELTHLKPKKHRHAMLKYYTKEMLKNYPVEETAGTKTFSNYSLKKQCISSTQFTCEKCNRNFPSASGFTRHRHNIKCKMCDSIFKPKYLKQHMEKHSTSRGIVCQDCGKTIKSRYSMKNHMMAHKRVFSVSCDKCDIKFVSKWAMHSHKYYNHFRAGVHVCPVCNKDRRTKYELKRHMVRHTNTRPFHCRVGGCDKGFIDNSTRNRHEQFQSGGKDYHCIRGPKNLKCPKNILQSSALQAFKKRHEDIMKREVEEGEVGHEDLEEGELRGNTDKLQDLVVHKSSKDTKYINSNKKKI